MGDDEGFIYRVYHHPELEHAPDTKETINQRIEAVPPFVAVSS